MFTYIFLFLFAFSLGGITVFIGVIVILFRFLTHFEDKNIEFKTRVTKSTQGNPVHVALDDFNQVNFQQLFSPHKVLT